MIPSEDNRNQWVLITGASSGIGETFAKRFAEKNWNTVLVARSKDKLAQLASSFEKQSGQRHLVIAADLLGEKAPEQVYREVTDHGIELEGLVNNAGVGYGKQFVDESLEQVFEMIDLNVKALVKLTYLFLPSMIARKRGFVLNVSSTASFQPLPYMAIYGATKSFVSSFTEALYLETIGTGVRILNFCPGLTKTNFGLRAGIRDCRLDPFAEEPEQVINTAFRALRGNAPAAVSGLRNQILVLLERLVPHRAVLLITLFIQNLRGRI